MHHTLIVDSRDRDYAKYENPSYYKIELPRAYYNVKTIKLLTCEIPQSFFVFSSALGNTSIIVSLYDSFDALITNTITIPDGNYELDTIASALKSSLDLAFFSSDVTFYVNVDPSTLKITISCVQGNTIVIDTTPAKVASTLVTGWGLAYNLGFTKNTVLTGSSITCQGVVSLDPYMYVLLDLKDLGRIDECSVNQPGNGGQVFAKIPIHCSTNFRNIINHGNACISSKQPFIPPISSITTMTVHFRFHDGNTIDFNNVDHSFSLEIECADMKK